MYYYLFVRDYSFEGLSINNILLNDKYSICYLGSNTRLNVGKF